MDRIGEPVVVREVPDPTPPAGGVVVRVHATGLCRSDWHAWAGHDDVALPHVPGHELAGVVAEVGTGVERWAVGDRVTVPFVCGCGRCSYCRSGDAQVCPRQQQPGFTHWGSFAELVALHAADTNLVAVPDGVSFAAAASLGCRFATAFRALTGRARLEAGEWLTVVGAGGVGLSAVMIAKALGAHVVAVDRHQVALDAARALGADRVLLADDVPSADRPVDDVASADRPVDDVPSGGRPTEGAPEDGVPADGQPGSDVAARVHELTGGGSHVAVDAVGSERTCVDAVLSLRRRGRHVQVGLLPPVAGHPRVPMDRVIGWELDLLGSHGMAAADYPAMLALIASGALRPQRLIERVVGLDEAAALLPGFDRASPAGMTMIDPLRG